MNVDKERVFFSPFPFLGSLRNVGENGVSGKPQANPNCPGRTEEATGRRSERGGSEEEVKLWSDEGGDEEGKIE